jgi:hypothetical protein
MKGTRLMMMDGVGGSSVMFVLYRKVFIFVSILDGVVDQCFESRRKRD